MRHISFRELDGSLRILVVLSPRERQVLRLVARGLLTKEIAFELTISVSTAKSVIAHLADGLLVRNRVEMALWFFENPDHIHGIACQAGLHPKGCTCNSQVCVASRAA